MTKKMLISFKYYRKIQILSMNCKEKKQYNFAKGSQKNKISSKENGKTPFSLKNHKTFAHFIKQSWKKCKFHSRITKKKANFIKGLWDMCEICKFLKIARKKMNFIQRLQRKHDFLQQIEQKMQISPKNWKKKKVEFY